MKFQHEAGNSGSGESPEKSPAIMIKIASIKGFTLVELMVVVAIVGMLSAIAVPNLVRARTSSQRNACVSNLRQIDSAIQRWALENNQPPGSDVTVPDITPYLNRATAASVDAIYCPADPSRQFATSYTLTDTSTSPTCNLVSTHVLD